MPKISSRIKRAYVKVQDIMLRYLERGISPSTDLLKQAFYDKDYDKDSRVQQETIYGCIIRGRDQAIDLWDLYLLENDGKDFFKDLAYIEVYEPEEWGKELKDKDFEEFHWKLHAGRFGEDTETIKRNLGHFPAIAVIFKRKMKEFSKKGHNFVIATGGKNSVWFIPSWWRWNIREYKYYRRTLKILYMQLKRGIKTKVILPSGVSLEEALKYGTVVEAALKDRTAWVCPNCGARNIEENKECAICKKERPVIKVKQKQKSKKEKKEKA